MRLLGVAIGFLTRIPLASDAGPDAIGRSARWFPLVGAGLGGVSVAILYASPHNMPSALTSILILIAEALLTGALHFDGLADTADGFGGGHTTDDVLRIMRDSAIGSYGALALIIDLALRAAAMTALIDRHRAVPFLVLAPALGRWSIVALARFLPYARSSDGVSSHVGNQELRWATLLSVITILFTEPLRGLACWCIVAAISGAFGRFCYRRIRGITGDTLGASVEIAQATVLLSAVLLT